MPTAHEHYSAQFESWEKRGRGWDVFDRPVYPEPPFVPFSYRPMSESPAVDDGRVPTFLSRLARKLASKPVEETPVEQEPEDPPEPKPLVRNSLVELQLALPVEFDVAHDTFEHFLNSIDLCREPVTFELLGSYRRVIAQFAAAAEDASVVRKQFTAHFPDVTLSERQGALDKAWIESDGNEVFAVEFGLHREFFLSLATGKIDPFVGIVAALSELRPGEVGLFQVLWQPVQAPWVDGIVDAVMNDEGKPFFVNAPELTKAAENKIASPLYAVVVRMFVCTAARDRLLQIARDLAGSLRVFAHPTSNELIPLRNDDYPFEDHIEDVLKRQTRRTGMLLNSEELTGFVHIPSSAVRSPAFQRQTTKTKAAPAVLHQSGVLLGENEHAGETVSVRLSSEQRTRHCHIIGASGTGKSTLLLNLIREDIKKGEGIAVLDPHGDLIDRICGIIPSERIDDVVLVDPADESHSVGFNILSAHSSLEKNLLASDLVAVFQRLSTSWGDQMNSVLQNAILAFLESPRRGTIADLRRFLIEPAFRNDFLKSVTDPEVVYYWQKSFLHLPSRQKSIGSILTRLDTFLAQKPIRHMVSQPDNKLDFAHIMDTGKIFLAKLPEGLLGRENSYLLGTLLVSKFQQIAMSRQAQHIAARRDFWLYIDEFANFITPSMAEILSGARKYRTGLTLAHHELHQLQKIPEVASAVMSHPYTRIVFRVGDDDARKLSEGFSFFEAKDLRNLETGQAICRVERSDYDFNLTIPLPDMPDETEANDRRQEVITGSRKKYGTLRADVEALLAKSRTSLGADEPPVAPPAPISRRTPAPQPAEVAPPSPPVLTPQEKETKELAQPIASDIPSPATARAGVVREAIPSPPLNLSKSPEPAFSIVPTTNTDPVEKKHEPARDLGRGGAQHQAIQKRIKEASEALGFRSVIEKTVLDGRGSVDLWLERANRSIACEISISTTIDHEVKNVGKCLKAGASMVAVICLYEERLKKIKAAVSGSFGADTAALVGYFQPDEFIAHVKTLPVEAPQKPEVKRRGYKVKTVVSQLSAEAQKEKEAAVNRTIADSLRRK